MAPDESKFASDRDRMVEVQLRGRGIRDERVLSAMRSVPRHAFLRPSMWRLAHSDQALTLSHGQTISQPYMVAAMTEALELRPDDRVLEIGTGSGYQTAVLARLAAEVYTVERIDVLVREARDRLNALGFDNVRTLHGDGSLGWPDHAPYDAIVVTAAAPSVPQPLLDQLGEGGRLVVPVGEKSLQDLVRYVRNGAELTQRTLMACRFVPLVGEEGWA